MVSIPVGNSMPRWSRPDFPFRRYWPSGAPKFSNLRFHHVFYVRCVWVYLYNNAPQTSVALLVEICVALRELKVLALYTKEIIVML